MWTCAQGAGGPLREVFCTGSAFTCTGFTCFAVDFISAGFSEGVVVLKGDADSGFFVLAMYCLLSFPYVTQYLEDIRWTFGWSLFVPTHFAEMRHIFSFYDHILGVIGNKYTHPEGGTMTEQVGAVIGICDYKSVQIPFTPELQVRMELSWYGNVCN